MELTHQSALKQLPGLVTEVINDPEEQKLWLGMIGSLSPSDATELAVMLKRQAIEQEVVENQHSLELREMAARFDKEWKSTEEKAALASASAAVSAPSPTPPSPAVLSATPPIMPPTAVVDTVPTPPAQPVAEDPLAGYNQ